MTNRKTTRRALVLSLLSLLLCCSMLVGTTFAWFTDSVTSGNNQIIAGNLDIELDYSMDLENWNDVTAAGDIFVAPTGATKGLWEPGHTEVAYLRVTNAGTLALKYRLQVSPFTETVGKNEKNEDIKLSEILKFAATEPSATALTAYTRETAQAAAMASTGTKLTEYTVDEIEVMPGDVQYIALVVYMPEEVGNEANYRGTTIPTIEFALNLFATQQTEESDSFDDQYDAGAPIAWTGVSNFDWYLADPNATEFEISTAEELAGFAAIVNGTAEGISQDNFKGQTVKLTKNIDLGNALWTPIGIASATSFSGTFDGQGNTIHNLHINIEDDRDYGGLFGITNGGKLKGITIRNVDIKAYIYVGAVVGYNLSGTVSDCHVEGDINIVATYAFAGGVIGSGYYSIDNCSVIADGVGKITAEAGVAGGLVGRCNEGSHLFADCVVKNLDISGGEQVGAISGFLHYGNIVSGCVAENMNLTLTATTEKIPDIGLAAGCYRYNASNPITITDNTFRNITLSAEAAVTGTVDILYGCEYDYGKDNNFDLNTNFILDNNIQENITNSLVYK